MKSIEQHIGQTGKICASIIQKRQNHENDKRFENWFFHRLANAANSLKNHETA